jgi:hypothetical protein
VEVAQSTLEEPNWLGGFHGPYSVDALQLQRAQTRKVPYPDLHIAHAWDERRTPELQLVGGDGSRAVAGEAGPTVKARATTASSKTADPATRARIDLNTNNLRTDRVHKHSFGGSWTTPR